MPMYDRQCRACDHRFEVFRRMADADSIVCEKCGSADLVRKVSSRRALVGLGDEAGHGRIYPYDDPNLGCRVHNAKHHRELMAREGLHHITREDVVAAGRRQTERQRQIEEIDREEQREFRRSRHYAEFRRLVDRGAYTEDVPREHRERVQKQLEEY